MTQDSIPTQWRKGMMRAMDRRLKATKCADGTFKVRSGSTDGREYRLSLTDAGKVGTCQCKAREHYGDDYPCAHRAAVAIALFALRGIQVQGVRA